MRNNMDAVLTLLTAFGFTAAAAKIIAQQAYNHGLTTPDVQAWINEAQASTSLTNPLGFVRARLQAGETLPERSLDDRHILQRHRYQQWASHSNRSQAGPHRAATQACSCGRVVWQDTLCENCGLCSKCCTCEPLDLNKE